MLPDLKFRLLCLTQWEIWSQNHNVKQEIYYIAGELFCIYCH